jgi:hypothetical protein
MALGYEISPRQGWQCPCCKAVFSPDTISCWNCRPITNATFTNATFTGAGTVTATPIPAVQSPEWELVSDSTGLVLKKKA